MTTDTTANLAFFLNTAIRRVTEPEPISTDRIIDSLLIHLGDRSQFLFRAVIFLNDKFAIRYRTLLAFNRLQTGQRTLTPNLIPV